MKRVIRLLPILFALPLLGLIPNSQRIEKAEAVNTTDRYFISDASDTYGITKSSANAVKVAYNSYSTVYCFETTDGGYNIKHVGTNTYLCHVENNPDLKMRVKMDGFTYVWTLEVVDETTVRFKSTDNRYLSLQNPQDTPYWAASGILDSTCNIHVYSFEEDAAPFVTAMSNIECDYSKKSPDTGEWEAAETAFFGTKENPTLKQPTRNFLKILEADMTNGTINTPERAVGKYDYIIKKYGTANYSNFINRTIPGLAVIDNIGFSSNVNNTPIIIVISFITVLSFTSILILKKKR